MAKVLIGVATFWNVTIVSPTKGLYRLAPGAFDQTVANLPVPLCRDHENRMLADELHIHDNGRALIFALDLADARFAAEIEAAIAAGENWCSPRWCEPIVAHHEEDDRGRSVRVIKSAQLLEISITARAAINATWASIIEADRLDFESLVRNGVFEREAASVRNIRSKAAA